MPGPAVQPAPRSEETSPTDPPFAALVTRIEELTQLSFSEDKQSRIRIQRWLARLLTLGSSSKAHRDNYAKLLFLQVCRGRLAFPFLTLPGPVGVAPFPSHLRGELVQKALPQQKAPVDPQQQQQPKKQPPQVPHSPLHDVPASAALCPTTLPPSPPAPAPAPSPATERQRGALLNELEKLRATVARQARDIAMLQTLVLEREGVITEQRQRFNTEIAALKSSVIRTVVGKDRGAAKTLVNTTNASQTRMTRAEKVNSWSKPKPDISDRIGAMLHAAALTTSHSVNNDDAVRVTPRHMSEPHSESLASSQDRAAPIITASTPPRRLHLPQSASASPGPSAPSQSLAPAPESCFEFLERSLSESRGSVNESMTFASFHTAVPNKTPLTTHSLDSDLQTPRSLDLSSGGATPLYFNNF